MSIKYEPSKIIQKIAPKKKLKKLVSSELTLKRTALSFSGEFDFLSKKKVMDVALKTLKSYKERIKENPELKDKISSDPKQLIQRVQNEVITQIATEIKDKYAGESYTWLPSSADEPDPEHQLNYGKVFVIGEGEQPGDRYGCQCGMEILVKGSSLDLG